MRFVERTEVSKLERTEERDRKFGSWVKLNVEDSISKRFWLDEVWRAGIRQYEAIPVLQSRELPRDNGQFIIEIPLGAMQCDTVISSITDLIYNTSPVFTVRGSPGYDGHAHAFQLLSDKLLMDDFVNLRAASDDVIADTVQMGTGSYYTVHASEFVKRATYTELNAGPRVFSVPPEDLIVPGGALPNVDANKLIGYRMYFSEAELQEAATINNWDISKFLPTGNVDHVRQRRVEVAHTDEDTETLGRLYEVVSLHCYYDYDEDGYAEDLLTIWDRTSFSVGAVSYAPYDSRPFSISRYQHRPHIFYGVGVLEMAMPFQREVTEWHNFKMQNAHLANARQWVYRLGAMGVGEEMKISPNKPIGLADPEHDLKELKMSDNYPTAQQYEAATIALAENRVGTSSLGAPGMNAGRRTPAATAMSILQSQNKRFASPFDNIRRAYADAMNQCFMRMREQHAKGGEKRKNVMRYITYAIGVKNAELIEQVFTASTTIDLRDKVVIEVTASSTSINRQADRQNALERMQVMGGYYQQFAQVGQIILSPQAPPELKQLMLSIAKAGNETVKNFLRTFDDVRDPEIFIPKMPGQETPDGTATPSDADAQQDSGGQPGTAQPPANVGAGEAGGAVQPTGEPEQQLGSDLVA